MTNAEIRAALLKYRKLLTTWQPAAFPTAAFVPDAPQEPTMRRVMQHVIWMLDEAVKITDESDAVISNGRSDIGTHRKLREKAIRWLCFVQGVLWVQGWMTIDEMKHDNRGLTAAETPTRDT